MKTFGDPLLIPGHLRLADTPNCESQVSPARTAAQNALAFAIHLIPTVVLALIVALSWRWKWMSVVLMTLFGAFVVVTLHQRGLWMASILFGLAGLLAIDALFNRSQAFR